jgi:hypothetical protein
LRAGSTLDHGRAFAEQQQEDVENELKRLPPDPSAGN